MAATDAEREDAAAALFKGFGYLFSRKHAASEQGYREAVTLVTGINAGTDAQFDLLKEAIAALPAGQGRTVTENAFGGYEPNQGMSLADRRRAIAELFDISARTVFRYESRGVHDLIKHIDRILERRKEVSLEDEEQPGGPEVAHAITDRANQLMAEIEDIDNESVGPITIAKMRDAVGRFLEDVALYDHESMASEEMRDLIKRYREWRERLDEDYYKLRMKNEG